MFHSVTVGYHVTIHKSFDNSQDLCSYFDLNFISFTVDKILGCHLMEYLCYDVVLVLQDRS